MEEILSRIVRMDDDSRHSLAYDQIAFFLENFSCCMAPVQRKIVSCSRPVLDDGE